MASALPLRIKNNDLISITDLENAINSPDGVVSDEEFERLISHKLSQNVSPADVSNSLTPSSISYVGDKNKFNGIMISNNEELIDSETMAIKFTYGSNTGDVNDDIRTYALYSNISNRITLHRSDTTSYIDSHLRMDVSYNNDLQESTHLGDSSIKGDWKMSIDRSIGNNNYFSAINSHLNTTDGSYPMKIEKNNEPRLYADGTCIFDIHPVTKQQSYDTFGSNNKFSTNNLYAEVDPNHNFVASDFTMYKLVQDTPTITMTLDTSASNLPLADASGNNITTPSLSKFENNVLGVIGQNITSIKDGYNVNIVIGEDTNGGFELDDSDNGVISIDTTNVLDSISFLEAGISNNTDVYVDISNGSVVLQGTDINPGVFAEYNVNSVNLEEMTETLESPYNGENGLVEIRVPSVTNRVVLTDVSSAWFSSVKILYNCDEAFLYDVSSHIDVSLTLNPIVSYNANVIVPTTTGNSYLLSDNCFNLFKSNDSVLVLAKELSYNPDMPNYEDMSFNSYINQLYSDNNTILHVKVDNQNILTEDTELLDDSGNAVPNSMSTVKIQNINLANSEYSDFQVKLVTKTITDLSNSASPTNGWKIESTNGSQLLHTSPIKNSVLYDDCLFMRSGIDLLFDYTFAIANPSITNAQSIKHRVDISFIDINFDMCGNLHLVPNSAYLDDDDITYTDLSYDVSQQIYTEYLVTPNGYGLTKENTILKVVKTTVSYYASFEPKLPFYTNIKLTSPRITEYVYSYKLYDSNNNKLPDVYLKYCVLPFAPTRNLALVGVSQSEVDPNVIDFYKTSLKVTPSNCSTLTAILQGKNTNDVFVDISGVPHKDQDPFFNTLTEFSGIDGYNANVSLVVQVTYPTVLNKPYYIVDTTNAPGSKVSFMTKLYKYDTTNTDITNNSFDNFNAYDNSWLSSSNGIVLNNTLELDANNRITLNIYGEDGETVLATIKQPNTIINDFNILYCVNPLVKVGMYMEDMCGNAVVDGPRNYSVAKLVDNTKREVFMDDGVYAYTNVNPPRGSYIEFDLTSDEVRVKFVSDSNYDVAGYNNGWNNFTKLADVSGNSMNQVLYSDGSIKLSLLSGSGGVNVASTVSFDKYRGYKYVGSGIDAMNIVRTASSARFVLVGDNGIYVQTYSDFATNGSYTVNNAVNQSDTDLSFNLGLVFNGLASLLSSESTRQYITITGASISWEFSNLTNDITYVDGSSNLTQSVFSELFGWKSRSIFSDYAVINVKYNIPEINVYNLDVSGAGVYGYPANKTNWTNLRSFTLTTSNKNDLISGLVVRRTQGYVPSSFTAYTVILPPQLRVTYNSDINTSALPFNPIVGVTSVYYITIVDKSTTTYNVSNKFNIIKNRIHKLQDYNTLNNEQIKILGNYINIDYYNDISQNEIYNLNSRRGIFNKTIDQLKGLNTSDLQVTMQNNSTLYDILYKQFVGGSGGSNINATYNIHFSISDAFIGPPPVSVYFELLTSQSTTASFFQSNIKLVDSSYILVIDKYVCPGVNYNSVMADTSLNELFFVASKHYTSSFAVDGTELPIGDSQLNINQLFSNIQPSDIEFEEDLEFEGKNVGVTLSALSKQGIVNLQNLVKYNITDYLSSSLAYINMPDIINVTSLFGSAVFRLTNSGNVKTPSVTSYSINIMAPTQLYDSGNNMSMNNNNFTNAGFINSETIINTMPNAPW